MRAGAPAAVPCDYRTRHRTPTTNRFWRKTMRDNDANGIYGDSQDGVDPNRNYPAKRGIDEEGASNSFSSGTYRGPYALSEPENLAVDRLQRRVPFKANINWHSAGQLLLTPVSYTTDYYPPDSTLFDAITGTDGDEAVFPYRSQHSSDLYESNGDTIDNAYMNYGIIGWTPEMDTCATMGEPAGCNQFASPDNESKVNAVFEKNLAFVLNVTQSLPNMGRPKNFDNDPSQYQVKATQDIQPNRFDVSYGATQVDRGHDPQGARRRRHHRLVVGQNGNVTIPMTAAPAGERYNEVKGYYFERRQATFPGIIGTRAVQAGDIVNVVVKAGGLQQEFRYRIAALPDDPGQEARARRRRRGLQGQVPEHHRGLRHRAALPRRSTRPRSRPPATRSRPSTSTTRRPTAARRTRSRARRSSTRPTSACCRTSTPSTTTRATTSPRRTSRSPTRAARPRTTAQTGNYEMAPWAHKVMLELREYANTGGKLLVDGRNVHQPFTSTERQPERDRSVHLDAGQAVRLLLPAEQRGRRRPARHRLAALAHDLQRHVAELPRRRRPPGRQRRHGHEVRRGTGHAGRRLAVRRHDAVHGQHRRRATTRRRTRTARRCAAKSPLRLRNWTSVSPNEPLRQETVQADYTTTPGPDGQRRRDHLDP